MALEISKIPRAFKFEHEGDDVILPDPNPNLTPKQVMELFMTQYPELTNATVGNMKIEDDREMYEFVTTVGNKG